MTKKYCLLLFLTFQLGWSQNIKLVDSLKMELQSETDNETKFVLYRSLFAAYYNSRPELAKPMIDSMKIVSSPTNRLQKGIIALSQGAYDTRMSDLDSGTEFTEKAIELLSFPEAGEEKAIGLSNLAMIKRRKGAYQEASSLILAALRLRDSLGVDTNEIAFNYHTLAAVYGDLKNYEESSNYFNKARKIYIERDNQDYVRYMDINLATNYAATGQFDKAEGLLLECADYFEKVNNFFTSTTTYLELGQLFLQKRDLEMAEFYLKKVISREKKLNHKEVMAVTKSRLAKVLFEQGRYQEALPYLQNSAASNESSGAIASMASDFGMISKVYAAINNYKQAYEYDQRRFKIEDSLTGLKNLETVNALKIEYETEKKDAEIIVQNQEIELLEKNVKVQNLKKTLYGIGMFSMFVIGGLLYFGFNQKLKKNRLATEKQQEIYASELAFKKKELTSQTLHLVRKNTFIQELKSYLDKVKLAPETFHSEFRRISVLLKKETAEDRDWEVFKSYFSQVHNDFDNKLRANANDVTEKEMRLASFIRMNLSTKEIASMFNVLPDSVLTSKYRLKKKLKLSKEEDLNKFLNAL